VFSAHSGEDELIVLGSTVMKDYYMVFDLELSRIGLAPKRSQYCRSNTDTLVTVGDNDLARLVLGILYLLVALGLSVKASVGWMQFYDVNLVAYICRKKS
jgi:hypothetical protein